MTELRKIDTAAELPLQWNDLAEEYFQQREFLLHTEKYNPCRQRYYLLYSGGTFITGMVVYTLLLDMFTYSFIRIPLRMNIIGIPCSVSASGFIGDEKHLPSAFELLKKQEQGFVIILNLNSRPEIQDVTIGHTLPTIVFQNIFPAWNDYHAALRSDYRRRMQLFSKPFANVRIEKNKCSQYTQEMQLQYLEVLARSKGKLETLTADFFRNLPPDFTLTACHDESKLLGWYITTVFRDKLYYFLGGFSYKDNPRYHTYFNLLSNILKEGIARKLSVIDLGQTAEVPKLRLGGRVKDKWMLGYHSNWLLRKFIILARGILEYKGKFPPTHTFKEER
jgi:hypothetical protein